MTKAQLLKVLSGIIIAPLMVAGVPFIFTLYCIALIITEDKR